MNREIVMALHTADPDDANRAVSDIGYGEYARVYVQANVGYTREFHDPPQAENEAGVFLDEYPDEEV